MLFERSIQSHLKIGIGNEIELKRIKLLVTCAKYSLHFFSSLSLCKRARDGVTKKSVFSNRLVFFDSFPFCQARTIPMSL